MNKTFILILEIIWIVTGILSIAAGVRYAIITGGPGVLIFGLLAIISFLFAWFRHRQRKNG